MVSIRISILVSILLFTGSLYGQLGVSLDFSDLRVTEWEEISGENSFTPSTQLRLNYWFALPEKRIDFLPTVFYFRSAQAEFFQEPGLEPDYYYISPSAQAFGFGVQIRLYPLDWEGDCNCPTFSKRGKLIEKGFFVYLMPMASWWRLAYDHGPAPGQVKPQNLATFHTTEFAGGIEAGAGLDIGLSDFLTLTPFVGYQINTEVPWNLTICNRCSELPVTARPTMLRAGVHIGFRWTR